MFGNLFSNSKNKRCPACGEKYSINLVKDDAENLLDDLFSTLPDSGSGQYLKDSGKYECRKCGKKFSGMVSVEWEKTAKKLGEEVAIREYKKIR